MRCGPLRTALTFALVGALLASCAKPMDTRRGAPPEREFKAGDLVKSDIDQMAEMHLDHSFAGVKLLMEKLYRRNPRELRKGSDATIEAAIARAFDPAAQWRFPELERKRGIDALYLSFKPEYAGDRVFAFGVGLASMIHLAYNDQYEFYFFDTLDPQALYNAARNVEIAAWKLGTSRDAAGQLLLLSNEAGPDVRNLSFEREIGKLIAYQDVLARVIAQRQNRTLRYVVQNITGAVFLPIR